MITRVRTYIHHLLETSRYDNPEKREIGWVLMDTLALAPRVDASQLERMFNSHLQDVLVVVYLSNLVRSQFDVANRLALVAT
jgi:translation initiation factor 3 subunit F